MECLRNYIGVKSCGFIPNVSGMYINSLPGVEFAQIDEIANADQQNYIGVWNDVQDRAILRFREDVIGRLSGFDKKYKLRQLTQTLDFGKNITQILTPASGTRRGHTIELNEKGAQCVCSNMQNIYVQYVQFYSIKGGPTDLYFTDIDLHIDLLKTTVNASTGWNIVSVEKEFEVSRLAINIDVTSISTPTLDLAQFFLGDEFISPKDVCGDCSSGWNGTFGWFDWGCSCMAIARGYQIDISDTSGTSEVYGQNTFGISTVYSIKCSYNNIVCKNKKFFANSFRWLLGVELMTERIYTSRINRWTTVDAKKATQLRKEFEIQYRGGQTEDGAMVEGALPTAMYGLDLNTNDCCLTMDAPIRFEEPVF